MPRHTSFPCDREPPEDLLRQLREVDPSLDLVYYGEGCWALGSVRPNRMRELIGVKMALAAIRTTFNPETFRTEEPSWPDYRAGKLAQEGFSPIAVYRTRDPDGRIVRDLLEREYNWRHRDRAAYDELEAVSLGEPEEREMMRQLRDRAEAGSRDRAIWRGSVSTSGRNISTRVNRI